MDLRDQLSEVNTAMNVLKTQQSRARATTSDSHGSQSAFSADTSNESEEDMRDDASQSSVASEIAASCHD